MYLLLDLLLLYELYLYQLFYSFVSLFFLIFPWIDYCLPFLFSLLLICKLYTFILFQWLHTVQHVSLTYQWLSLINTFTLLPENTSNTGLLISFVFSQHFCILILPCFLSAIRKCGYHYLNNVHDPLIVSSCKTSSVFPTLYCNNFFCYFFWSKQD